MPEVISVHPLAEARSEEVWQGASGARYPYQVLEIGLQPNTAYGNYIFAKKDAAGAWSAIYMGHGDLSVRGDLPQHPLRTLIESRGATHVHLRENPSLPQRMIERADLLERHPEVCRRYSSM